MRWICLLLLLANLGYFGWMLDQRTREEVRYQTSALDVPDNVPRLQLVSELEHPPVRQIVVPAEITAEDTPEEDSATLSEVEDSPALVTILPGIGDELPESLLMLTQLETNACFSFGPFTDHDRAGDFLDWLKARQAHSSLRREADDGNLLFWVYLKPRSNAEARATLDELRDQGVQDISLMDSGDLKNAISLGLFSTQASVNRRLRELENKGHQPVVVPYDQGDTVYWVDARINQGKLIDEMSDAYPSGLNFVPIACAKIALAQSDQ